MGEGAGDVFEFEAARSEEDLRRSLSDAGRETHLVILGNRLPRSAEARRELVAFVRSGGALLVFTGDAFDVRAWNEEVQGGPDARFLPFEILPAETHRYDEGAPQYASTLRHDARLTVSDQWTLSSAIRPLMPLHRLGLGDVAGTELYVSALTGEPVLKSTRRERLWNYLGAVTHWLYFTPLRRNTGLCSIERRRLPVARRVCDVPIRSRLGLVALLASGSLPRQA